MQFKIVLKALILFSFNLSKYHLLQGRSPCADGSGSRQVKSQYGQASVMSVESCTSHIAKQQKST